MTPTSRQARARWRAAHRLVRIMRRTSRSSTAEFPAVYFSAIFQLREVRADDLFAVALRAQASTNHRALRG